MGKFFFFPRRVDEGLCTASALRFLEFTATTGTGLARAVATTEGPWDSGVARFLFFLGIENMTYVGGRIIIST